MKRIGTVLVVVMFLVGVLALGAFGPTLQVARPVAAAAPSSDAITPPAMLTGLESTLEQIYAKVSPSVVNIQVVLPQQASVSPSAIPGFPYFGQQPQQQYAEALGSGFVWDKQGDIVTNNHVVAGASKITVTFSDGSMVPAKVVGTDPASDLAVIKVNVPASRLQPVTLADSSQLKVGQLNVAIGNPFGLKGTMTVGFISALGRLLPAGSASQQGPSYSIPDIIQTDAPINPGNSGGVLLNDQGQLIGVTSAIISPVKASSGVGFAIPSNIVKEVATSLIKTGQFEHPWLGLSGTSLTPELNQAMHLKAGQEGALIVNVTPGGPAAKANLLGSTQQATILGQQVSVGGDVIVALNGQTIKSFDNLINDMAMMQVGQKVTLTVLHNGQTKNVEITLTARPQQPTA